MGTVGGMTPGGGRLGALPCGLLGLLAIGPVGLGMIALPVRTWLGSIVGGGVGVGRTPVGVGATGGVGVPLPPHATSKVMAKRIGNTHPLALSRVGRGN